MSPNRALIEEFRCSPPLPVLDPVLAPPTVDDRGVALMPPRLVIPAGSALLLFSLHALTTVELECAFTDTHIAFLSKAWPNLRSFVLRSPALSFLHPVDACTTGANFVPKPTILALRFLAHQSPRLERLEMDVQPPPAVALSSLRSTVLHCPTFGPRLERLCITGWMGGPSSDSLTGALVRFLVVFQIRAVPPTCRLSLPGLALSDLGDLFGDIQRLHDMQARILTASVKQAMTLEVYRRLAWPRGQSAEA